MALVAVNEVKVPAAAAVPPIAGGDARYVEKPVPETVLDADKVVNAPAAAAVPPIAGGLARYVLKPVPETVLDADKVVNAPAAAAVPPIAGGEAKYVLKPVPLTVLDADKVVNAPVEAVVAPIDILLIVPTPVEVKASVGVLLAVNVIKFVYETPSTSYAARARVLVAA